MYTPEPFNRLIKCRHGNMLYFVNDIIMGNSLNLYGEYCEGELDLLKQIIRSGDVVLDVGAHIGTHTLFFSKAVNMQGKVLAFEAQRIIFQTLCANIALNSIANTYCYNLAVGESTGSVKAPTINFYNNGNYGGFPLGIDGEGEMVQIINLDSLNLPQCRLIKIDVEAMELHVLKGAVKTIDKFKPILYVENDREEISSTLIQFINGLGYESYWHKPPLFRENNYFNNQKNVLPGFFSTNMLCLHPSQNISTKDLKDVELVKTN